MLTLKTGAFGAFVAGTIVTALVVGCAASGATDGPLPTTDVKSTDPAPSNGKKVPPPSGGTSAGDSGAVATGDDDDNAAPINPTDSGASSTSGGTSNPDSGTIMSDAGGAPPAVVGASCSVQDMKYPKVCGHCGSQEAICAPGASGSLEVSGYGPCGNEHGVCSAGDVQPCGSKCGTQTCGSTCGWGACKNEGVCKPGLIQHDTAGCPTPGTYRSKECADTCSFGGLSACTTPEIILPDVGKTSITEWELTTAIMGKRPSSCKKTASVQAVTGFPVPLRNPSNTDAVVSIWHTSAGAGVDTVIATYADTVPVTDSDFKACKTEPQDACDQLPPHTCDVDGSGSWAGVDNVTVPANSTVIIYSSGWLATTTGKFVLNVKTKSH